MISTDVQEAVERTVTPPRVSLSERRQTLWIALALGVATFAIYFRTVHNGFISYDDPDYITNNPLVRQGLTWHGIGQAFRTIDQGNWFPLEWISLMATSRFFGLSPAAYHLTNLFLHAFNVVLVFVLLQKATLKIARSTMVAALFAVFPLNVEAVAWATERKSVLSVFFLLLAIWAYGWYTRRPGFARYLAIVACFALSLMTKAWGVTLPFVLLLLDYWPLQRFGPRDKDFHSSGAVPASFARLVFEKIPLFGMSLATTLVGIYAARAGGAFSTSTARAALSLRFENAVWAYLAYILKGIWPTHLAIIYPFPQHLYPTWEMVCAGAFLAAVTGLVWRARGRYLIVCWLWYLGVLFPVIGLVQTGTQSMADRWAYISFWGIFVAVVWWLADLATNLRISRRIVSTAAVMVLGAYAFAAYEQAGYWHDSIALYTHALAVTKHNGPVRVNLGIQYEQAGRPDLALQQYGQAVADMPSLGIAHYNLARLLAVRHEVIEATAEYRLAISCSGVPRETADAHVGLGSIYVGMNLPAKAIAEFTEALAAKPDDVYALLDRGMIEFRQGDLESARKDFTSSAQLFPTPMTWYTLGLILESQHNIQAAERAYQAALYMNPNLKDAQEHLRQLAEIGR